MVARRHGLGGAARIAATPSVGAVGVLDASVAGDVHQHLAGAWLEFLAVAVALHGVAGRVVRGHWFALRTRAP
jgi:hypothetical protein